jgi:hypothetical protein
MTACRYVKVPSSSYGFVDATELIEMETIVAVSYPSVVPWFEIGAAPLNNKLLLIKIDVAQGSRLTSGSQVTLGPSRPITAPQLISGSTPASVLHVFVSYGVLRNQKGFCPPISREVAGNLPTYQKVASTHLGAEPFHATVT